MTSDDDLKAERDELRAAVEQARKLHQPYRVPGEGTYCDACDHAWPCPTIRAINGGEPFNEVHRRQGER